MENKLENKTMTWFEEQKQDWNKIFQETSFPAPKDENWRFSNFKKIPNADDFVSSCHKSHVQDISHEEVKQKFLTEENKANTIIRINGQIIFIGENLNGSSKISIYSLKNYEQSEIAKKTVEKELFELGHDLGSKKYASLYFSKLNDFMLISLDGESKEKVNLIDLIVGKCPVFLPKLIIHTDKFAQLLVSHELRSSSDKTLTISGNTLTSSNSSKISYFLLQDLGKSAKHIQFHSSKIGKDSVIKSIFANVGCDYARMENTTSLLENGADSKMYSICLLNSKQTLDQRTFQFHKSPHTTSDLFYKNALLDSAQSIFSGVIHVDEGAHFTDAYQTCRNLLLTEEAQAHSMPGLEINANEVKCSHGSTSSTISEEEVFYLMSRGISRNSAKRHIALGFLADLIEKEIESSQFSSLYSNLRAKF